MTLNSAHEKNFNGPSVDPQEALIPLDDAEKMVGDYQWEFRRALRRGEVAQFGPHVQRTFVRQADVEAFVAATRRKGKRDE